jgi:hypothetical protein
LRFLLEIFFSFSECRISFLIYLVGVSFLLSLLEVIVLVLTFFFLRPFFEIVVEASSHLNQLGLIFWKFLNDHSIFDAFGQFFVELCYFNPLVLGHSDAVLRESN